MDIVNLIAATDSEADLHQVLSNHFATLTRLQIFDHIIILFDRSLLVTSHVSEAVLVAWNYLVDHHIWDTHYPTLTDFEQHYPHMSEIKSLIEETTRTRQRTQQNIATIQQNWGIPLTYALPTNILPPRISYHTSRGLIILSRNLTPTAAAHLLSQNIINRQLTSSRNSPTYFTNSDVRSAISQLLNPSNTTHNQIQTLVDESTSLIPRQNPIDNPTRPTFQVVIPFKPPASSNITIQTTSGRSSSCYCPIDVLEQLQILYDNPTPDARNQAFDIGVQAPLSRFCWNHIRPYFRLSMGFLSNTAEGRHNLEARILALHSHSQSNGLRSDFIAKHPTWFNADTRLESESDAWRPYRYPHHTPQPPDIQPDLLFFRFTNDPNAYQTFLETGNIIVPDFFAYLNTPQIQSWIDMEFKLYRYHFRSNPGSPAMGFLRNCFYSLIQQAFRMDPGYYVINVAARPSHHWRLISYPYVAKETVIGERTLFMHLDINLDNYFSDQMVGSDQLTSSVSIDDEDNDNCTMLVPGFMNHAMAWHERVKARTNKDTSQQHTTEALKNYTREDQELFGKPQPFPCPAFGIRITLPTVLHGSSPKATICRRVIYPWFTAIQSDHETPEIPGQHPWSEISNLHRDLEAPIYGVAGDKVTQDRPPYRFPAAIKLDSVSPLSDALVGRRRWTDPEVTYERDILLGPDHDKANILLSTIRDRIYRALLRAYSQIQALEQYSFGDVSFFANDGIQPPTPTPYSP